MLSYVRKPAGYAAGKLLANARSGFLVMVFALLYVGSVSAVTSTVDPGLVDGESTFGRQNQMVLDGSGHPVAVFQDPDSVYLIRCNDPSCSGGDDIARLIVSQAIKPSLALDDSGFPVITYFAEDTQELKLVRCNDPDCTGNDETVTVLDNTGFDGGSNSLALDGAGNPVVAYEDGTTDDLRLIHCNDSVCSGGDESNELVDNLTSAVGTVSLRLDTSGNPVIAYYGDFNLVLAHCNDSNCSGGDESIQTVDSSAPFSATLRLDGSGNPVIGYATGGNVKVAHCNDPDCDPGVGGTESVEIVAAGGGPSMRLDSAGRPGLSFTENGLRFVQCNDVNCAGGDEVVSPSLGYANFETSLGRDASGNPILVGFRSPGLRIVHCNDTFCLDGDESLGFVGQYKIDVGSHIAFTSNGSEFFFAYRDATNGILRFRHCDDEACSGSGDTFNVVDSNENVGQYSDLVLDGGGLPFVSYYDSASGNLKTADCSNATCSSPTLFTIDSEGDVGQHTAVTIDASGLPVISYHDADDGALKVAHCDAANCASFDNSVQTVDDGGGNSVGLHTDIVLDTSGFPVISYYNESASTLMLAHCNDADCDPTVNGPESIESLDTTASAGLYTSLRLDSSGNPVVSYFDLGTSSLKVVNCGDSNCSGGGEVITVVDDGDGQRAVGLHTSMTLNSHGNPVISYRDTTLGELKIAECNDAECNGSDDNIFVAESNGDVGQYSSLFLAGSAAYVGHYDEASQSAVITRAELPGFAPPAAPDGLAATATSETAIELSWNDNSDDETGFRIERSTDGGGSWLLLAEVGADTTTYADSGLSACQEFSYRVRAERSSDGAVSSYSNVASATPDCPPPVAPDNLTATSISETAIALSWSDNSDDETGFRIERSDDAGTTWASLADVAADSTSYTDSGLSACQEFSYRVRAERSLDGAVSSYSNVTSATTDCSPPAAPDELTATAVSTNAIELVWNDNSDGETAFRIERSDDEGTSWALLADVAADSTSYTDSGLSACQEFSYRVRAERSSDGTASSYSNVDSTMTECPPVIFADRFEAD